jgi:hypothetical protein
VLLLLTTLLPDEVPELLSLLLLLIPELSLELLLLPAFRTVLLALLPEVFLLPAVRTVLLALLPEVFLLTAVRAVLLLLFVERLLTLTGSRLEPEFVLANKEFDLLYELPAGCLLYDSL